MTGTLKLSNAELVFQHSMNSWVEQPRPEVPQRAFTSVTDGRYGLTIANRGLPEVEVLKNSDGNAEIAVTFYVVSVGYRGTISPPAKDMPVHSWKLPGRKCPGYGHSIIP